MGLGIDLQDERGVVLASFIDGQNLLSRLLPEFDDETYPMLSSIDPYGNTVFNCLQIRRFLAEWSRVTVKARTAEEQTLMDGIEKLARRCRDEVHLYLKFIGD